MSQYGIFYTPHLTFNSVDLSSHIRRVELEYDIEGQDDTEATNTSRTEAPGLIVNRMTVEFNQDFAASGAGSVDATIGAVVAARSSVAITYRHDVAVKSTTNPAYTGTVFVKKYTPIAQRIGDMAVATVEFGFTTALTRDAS